MRSGFDPSKLPRSGSSDFAIGDDDKTVDADEEFDETRRWKDSNRKESHSQNPKSDYGTLDEGHVWNVNDSDNK